MMRTQYYVKKQLIRKIIMANNFWRQCVCVLRVRDVLSTINYFLINAHIDGMFIIFRKHDSDKNRIHNNIYINRANRWPNLSEDRL